MQISIIFSKNEVLSMTIFEYCQNIIKLLFLMFQCTVYDKFMMRLNDTALT